jgi:hypothetical protein
VNDQSGEGPEAGGSPDNQGMRHAILALPAAPVTELARAVGLPTLDPAQLVFIVEPTPRRHPMDHLGRRAKLWILDFFASSLEWLPWLLRVVAPSWRQGRRDAQLELMHRLCAQRARQILAKLSAVRPRWANSPPGEVVLSDPHLIRGPNSSRRPSMSTCEEPT